MVKFFEAYQESVNKQPRNILASLSKPTDGLVYSLRVIYFWWACGVGLIVQLVPFSDNLIQHAPLGEEALNAG